MASIIIHNFFIFLNRFFNFQFGFLRDNSMGRQAVNLEFWLRKNKKRKKSFFFSSCNPANQLVFELQNRQVKIFKSPYLYDCLKNILEKDPLPKYLVDLSSTGFYHWDQWTDAGPQLSFNSRNLEEKDSLFKKFNIPQNKKIVCVHARSNFYVDTLGAKRDPYWQRNDFRDCCIKNFGSSIDWLIENDYYVVLLNHPDFDKPYENKHKNILDLGTTSFSSKRERDCLTLFLTSSCFFLLGNTSGIYLLASIFDRPVAYTNLVPLGECGRKKTDLFILKRYFSTKKNSYISFKEIIKIGGDMDTLNEAQLNHLKEESIEIRESSPEEILGLTKEMIQRLNGEYTESPKYIELKEKFHNMFKEGHPMRSFPSPIAESFLTLCEKEI